MELLAPAGGFEQLRSAIAFGADAVYLAADKFGMRARAANFALEDLPRAVEEAHAAGVRVYVTCNVTIMEGDLAELPAYLRAVDASGADALIIGDLGAFALAREHAPSCQLHVSTQANVANAEAAKMWHALGAARIVCAREMTLADIAQMRTEVPDELEIEAFVHGAQCMAVSSRCLISSYLTGRSGNRGHCTQPCRWNYALVEEKRPGEFFPVEEAAAAPGASGAFIMNAMDLNMVSHIAELRRAGVDSVKIEGRNKKAFYVATVVGAYRRAIDGTDSLDALEAELRCISHRPYSHGFYFGEPQQACDYDGYEQETLHVADVVACEEASAGTGMWRVTLRCRNRFAEGDEVEALIPRESTCALVVRDLHWLPRDEEGALLPSEPVAVANRATDLYAIEAASPIPSGSFIRCRQHRRSARHPSDS